MTSNDTQKEPLNPETIQPTPGYVLILEQEEPTDNQVIVPDESKQQAQFCKILAVGGAYHDFGTLIEPAFEAGQYAYFAKWQGIEIERGRGKEKKKYKLIKCQDIYGVINS